VAIAAAGTQRHLKGYEMIRVFRIDAPDGDADYWATSDLKMDEATRRAQAELVFAIENDHRDLKQNCGVEKCQARSERAPRHHIGLAIRAFLRLEWHHFSTGISGFLAKTHIINPADVLQGVGEQGHGPDGVARAEISGGCVAHRGDQSFHGGITRSETTAARSSDRLRACA
jgi:hypothetical protein